MHPCLIKHYIDYKLTMSMQCLSRHGSGNRLCGMSGADCTAVYNVVADDGRRGGTE